MLLVTVLLKHVMQCGETTRQVIYPFLQRHASMVQLQNTIAIRGQPGLGQPAEVLERIPAREARSHRDLLRNDEFLGKMEVKRWDQIDAINEYEVLKSQIRELLESLDSAR